MADRKRPCVNCGTKTSSMTYASDPWCGDTCHKAVANILATPQKELNAALYIQAERAHDALEVFGPTSLQEEVHRLVEVRHSKEIIDRYGYQGATAAMRHASPGFTNGLPH